MIKSIYYLHVYHSRILVLHQFVLLRHFTPLRLQTLHYNSTFKTLTTSHTHIVGHFILNLDLILNYDFILNFDFIVNFDFILNLGSDSDFSILILWLYSDLFLTSSHNLHDHDYKYC